MLKGIMQKKYAELQVWDNHSAKFDGSYTVLNILPYTKLTDPFDLIFPNV